MDPSDNDDTTKTDDVGAMTQQETEDETTTQTSEGLGMDQTVSGEETSSGLKEDTNPLMSSEEISQQEMTAPPASESQVSSAGTSGEDNDNNVGEESGGASGVSGL